jgi:predicted dehydrogenase
MIDFFAFLTESTIVSLDASSLGRRTDYILSDDNFAVTLKYENGSVCSLIYISQGAEEMGKEYIEIHADQKTVIIDNFRSLSPFGTKHRKIVLPEIQKGHLEELKEFAGFIKGEHDLPPISLKSMLETTKVTFRIQEILKEA